MAFADLLTTADRSVLARLGGAVRYTPEAGDPIDLRGIFDAAYVRAESLDASVASSQPAVFLRLEDLPEGSDPEDATVTVGGASYTVHEAKRDGMGGVVLMLNRA